MDLIDLGQRIYEELPVKDFNNIGFYIQLLKISTLK